MGPNPLAVLKLVMTHCQRMQKRMMGQLAAAESRHRRVRGTQCTGMNAHSRTFSGLFSSPACIPDLRVGDSVAINQVAVSHNSSHLYNRLVVCGNVSCIYSICLHVSDTVDLAWGSEAKRTQGFDGRYGALS